MKDESRLIYSFYNNKQKNDLLSLMLFTCIILNNIYNITKMYILLIICFFIFLIFLFYYLLLFFCLLLRWGGEFSEEMFIHIYGCISTEVIL